MTHLIDTDILTYFFKGNETVKRNFESYFSSGTSALNISVISYYEILSGLKAIEASKQIKQFESFISYNLLIEVSPEIAEKSADTYAFLKKKGRPIGDADILIASTALVFDLILVTNNEKHFSNIPKLTIENWSKKLYLK